MVSNILPPDTIFFILTRGKERFLRKSWTFLDSLVSVSADEDQTGQQSSYTPSQTEEVEFPLLARSRETKETVPPETAQQAQRARQV
jgi:hypothetical protein